MDNHSVKLELLSVVSTLTMSLKCEGYCLEIYILYYNVSVFGENINKMEFSFITSKMDIVENDIQHNIKIYDTI